MQVEIAYTAEQPAPGEGAASTIDGVSLAEAMARENFEPLPSDAEVYTARVVTPDMGENLEKDPSKPEQIVPDFNGDLVWVVRLHHVPTANHGPMNVSPTPDAPQQYADQVIFMKPSGFFAGTEVPNSTN